MMSDYVQARRRTEVLRPMVNPSPLEPELRKPIPHEQEQNLVTSRIDLTHSQGNPDRIHVKLDPAEAKR
ncbi:hypothetical protein Pst134EA_013810 [Puccinia striiformis f. sp. tritici]|uniref:hypothetical protein n=1 Tax=Puccinia striiformis f. sp. tritici TaxID=168172 RepID=UPI0020085E44|nr:hypothetical protein Pst134EA_013810 [Puccinia striiformis f. sp. tritici]KAH9454708.1 hypothetical protein Pst134EB_014773 [Puccinia striiformis f. sp. tritici]KAH9465956.1 hypothetical protein Pst134EA_013810 [Puccinia striiformis f. sp. tritici]